MSFYPDYYIEDGLIIELNKLGLKAIPSVQILGNDSWIWKEGIQINNPQLSDSSKKYIKSRGFYYLLVSQEYEHPDLIFNPNGTHKHFNRELIIYDLSNMQTIANIQSETECRLKYDSWEDLGGYYSSDIVGHLVYIGLIKH